MPQHKPARMRSDPFFMSTVDGLTSHIVTDWVQRRLQSLRSINKPLALAIPGTERGLAKESEILGIFAGSGVFLHVERLVHVLLKLQKELVDEVKINL